MSETWLQKVRRQLEFYFSDANLRSNSFLRRKIEEEEGGFVDISFLLTFNRLQALRCKTAEQLLRAAEKSDLLELSADRSKLRRDPLKGPIDDADPTRKTIYVEGLPLTLGLDDLTRHFSQLGRVALLQLPHHRETREPRGFCFVEFATEKEAVAAVSAVHNSWPQSWPPRSDGKALRALTKQQWLDSRRDYQALKSSVVKVDAAAPQGAGAEARPGARQKGCLLLVSGFPPMQTVLSIRHFAEHVVPVEYCDLPDPDVCTAIVRLRSPADCRLLLDDLSRTGRMLGWLKPEVRILDEPEEAKYWLEVDQRRGERTRSDRFVNDSQGPRLSKRARRRLLRPLRSLHQNPQGVVRGGPAKMSTIRTWPQRGEVREAAKDSFIDTVGGNAGFTKAGFARRRGRRGLGVPSGASQRGATKRPPPTPSSAQGAKIPRRVPPPRVMELPPPSPYLVPTGTKPKQKAAPKSDKPRAPSVPPPSPVASKPRSPKVPRLDTTATVEVAHPPGRGAAPPHDSMLEDVADILGLMD